MEAENTVDMTSEVTRSFRIHVGNLPLGYNPSLVKNLFTIYGKIVGVRPKKNYMFVQFATEESAKLAIMQPNKIEYQGKTVSVKPAKTSSGSDPKNVLKTTSTNAVYQARKKLEICTTPEVSANTINSESCSRCEIILDSDASKIYGALLAISLDDHITTKIMMKVPSVSINDVYMDVFSKGCMYAISIDKNDFKESGKVKLKMADSVNDILEGTWKNIVDYVIQKELTTKHVSGHELNLHLYKDIAEGLMDKYLRGEESTLHEYEFLSLYFQKLSKMTIKKEQQQTQQQQQYEGRTRKAEYGDSSSCPPAKCFKSHSEAQEAEAYRIIQQQEVSQQQYDSRVQQAGYKDSSAYAQSKRLQAIGEAYQAMNGDSSSYAQAQRFQVFCDAYQAVNGDSSSYTQAQRFQASGDAYRQCVSTIC